MWRRRCRYGPDVTDANRATVLQVACDAVSLVVEAGQLLDVDVNQVPVRFSVSSAKQEVLAHIPQTAQAQVFQRSVHA